MITRILEFSLRQLVAERGIYAASARELKRHWKVLTLVLWWILKRRERRAPFAIREVAL